MRLPEAGDALLAQRLARQLGRGVGVGVRAQGVVPPRDPQLVREAGFQAPENCLGLLGVRALEVGELDDGDERIGRPAHGRGAHGHEPPLRRGSGTRWQASRPRRSPPLRGPRRLRCAPGADTSRGPTLRRPPRLRRERARGMTRRRFSSARKSLSPDEGRRVRTWALPVEGSRSSSRWNAVNAESTSPASRGRFTGSFSSIRPTSSPSAGASGTSSPGAGPRARQRLGVAEGKLAREHLVEDHPQGEDVGALVLRRSARLLGRHVGSAFRRPPCAGRRRGPFRSRAPSPGRRRRGRRSRA